MKKKRVVLLVFVMMVIGVQNAICADINADNYDHIFRDQLRDYFYFNEFYAADDCRVFEGVWKYRGTIHKALLIYQPETGVTTMHSRYTEFRTSRSFYYSLKPTQIEKHHTGAYVLLKEDDSPYNIYGMEMTWTKGGY